MEDLMARMECDTAQVAERIVALVIDSFQDTQVNLSEQVAIVFPSFLRLQSSFHRLIGVSIYFKIIQKQQDDFTSWRKVICHQPMLVSSVLERCSFVMFFLKTARLILAINQFLVHIIEHGTDAPGGQQQNGDDGMENGDEENESMNTVSIHDTTVICGLLETMVILWEGNRQRFDKVVSWNIQ